MIAGLLLGALIGIKQYAVLIALPSAVYAAKVGGWRAPLRAAGAALLLLLVLVVPFAISDFDSLYHQLAGTLLQRELRSDSLSIPALVVNLFQEGLPETTLALVTGLGAMGSSLWLARRHDVDEHDFLSAVLMSFAVAFLFGKQAFCNYYYLLAALYLTRACLAPRHAVGKCE